MPNYANLSGRSNVRSYEFGPGFINVTFKDGRTYRYSLLSAGPTQIAEMQQRARAGWGLNRYITKVVRGGYESKW